LQRLSLIALIFVAFACNKKGSEDAIIAQVGDKTLTWTEMQELIPDDASPEDSILLAEKYLKDWVTDQVVVAKAQENLSEEAQNFDEQIENYRKTLLTYAYEQELVRQQLDTNVSAAEIEKYYNDNISSFELHDYIVKVKFCATNTDSKDLKQLKKLFYSNDPKDFAKWEAFCVEKQINYFIDEDNWMMWDDLIKKIPIQTFDVESFLTRNKSVEIENGENTHFIMFLDYQLSGSQSPLSFEKDKIKAMIINKRKLDLIAKMKEDLYNEAITNEKVETYLKDK
jgi:hypothetical protein